MDDLTQHEMLGRQGRFPGAKALDLSSHLNSGGAMEVLNKALLLCCTARPRLEKNWQASGPRVEEGLELGAWDESTGMYPGFGELLWS